MKRSPIRTSHVLGVAAVAALAVACGGSSSGGSTASVAAGSGSGAAGTAVKVSTHSGPMGSYVTDQNGRSLYRFSADKGTTSACSGGCTAEWPAAKGAGGAQLVFHGHPLYYFAGDHSAGDTSGEGLTDFGGTWTLIAPDGAALAAGSSTSGTSGSSGGSSSSSGSSGGNGWG